MLASVAGWMHRKPVAYLAALLAQQIDCCAPIYVCAAVIFSKERASAQLGPLSREARGIELLNFYHFDEVILSRDCTWT